MSSRCPVLETLCNMWEKKVTYPSAECDSVRMLLPPPTPLTLPQSSPHSRSAGWKQLTTFTFRRVPPARRHFSCQTCWTLAHIFCGTFSDGFLGFDGCWHSPQGDPIAKNYFKVCVCVNLNFCKISHFMWRFIAQLIAFKSSCAWFAGTGVFPGLFNSFPFQNKISCHCLNYTWPSR